MRDDTPPELRDQRLSPRDDALVHREIVSFRLSVPLPENGSLVCANELFGDERNASADDLTPANARLSVAPPPLPAVSNVVDSEETQVLPIEQAEELTDADQVSDVAVPASVSTTPHPIWQSLCLIASMVVMLLIARFSVPRIVEEIRYSWHLGEMRAEYEMGGQGLKNVSLESLSRAYEMVTSAVVPSVVHIDVRRRANRSDEQMQQLLGSDLFGLSDQGSGVVVDADGYILTNAHVVADGETIFVTLSDGRRLAARVVGTDSLTDLAVLKIEADRLMPIRWGDSEVLKAGSPVWAVGSPFGLDRTITFGILSGKHRKVIAGERYGASRHYQDFMQSDVAVNPGNSGGPLVDARGTLVGINTAILGDTYQGVSFSIPSNLSKQIYESIRKTGRVQRGYLGVQLTDVPDEMLSGENTRLRGALVGGIAGSGSPGGMAGLMTGDVIERADGKQISDMGHLMRVVGDAGSGTSIEFDVRRGEEALKLTVVLGNRPFDLDQRPAK
jgi:S1-C subfamily serine protease